MWSEPGGAKEMVTGVLIQRSPRLGSPNIEPAHKASWGGPNPNFFSLTAYRRYGVHVAGIVPFGVQRAEEHHLPELMVAQTAAIGWAATQILAHKLQLQQARKQTSARFEDAGKRGGVLKRIDEERPLSASRRVNVPQDTTQASSSAQRRVTFESKLLQVQIMYP